MASPSRSRISSWRRLPIWKTAVEHHPQPAPEHALPPGGLVGVDDAGGPHLFEQILDDRFAGKPDLAQAAVEGAHRQRHAKPSHQELTDASAGLMAPRP